MQGFNMGRYVPPELEGTTSFNAASGKGHALGARARKLKSEGILTVRFELPFAVWCTHCQPEQIIGQGVRFNAEKKKVGNYYSTPIWSFRFKHTACGGSIEVRTDPKNTAYVVTEGGKRRDTGEDRLAEGEIVIGPTDEEKERLEKDGAFGALEKKVEDQRLAAGQKTRLEELIKRSERDWDDPYEQSRRLRSHFREGRNIRKAEAERTENLKEKMSLGIDLAEETNEDTIRAQMIDFDHGAASTSSRGVSIFPSATVEKGVNKDGGKRGKRQKPDEVVAAKRARLADELRGNTRAGLDPFLTEKKAWQPSSVIRKNVKKETTASQKAPQSAALVDYDSD